MKAPKTFEKIAILKISELVFFRGVKTPFGKLPLEIMHFQPCKKIFQPILCVSF
jgi:hypothetical protein